MNHTFKLSLAAAAFGSFCAVAAAQGQGGVVGPAPAAPAGYWAAKAQCWRDLSASERSQGDTHGTPLTAAGNADRIHAALLAGTEPGTDAELPIFAQKFLPAGDKRYGRPQWRADILYIDSIVERYKAGLCRTPQLGCLEVAQASVYENMEETKGARWNHGRPEIDAALVLAHDADSMYVAACIAKELEEVPMLIHIRPEIIELPADVLFAFDSTILMDAGVKAVGAFVDGLANRRSLKLNVIGHTDRFGSESYNAKLSLRRASVVKAEILLHIPTADITSTGAGSKEPVVNCAGKKSAETLACLARNRRVVLHVFN